MKEQLFSVFIELHQGGFKNENNISTIVSLNWVFYELLS